MPAHVITPPPLDVEPDELEPTPMTDSEHKAVFGWAWDDPDAEAPA